MKQLYLARHAKAEFNDDIADRERALTSRGVNDCISLANAMTALVLPQLIICSAVRRTQDTAEHIVHALQKDIPIKPMNELYGASANQIKDIIAEIDEQYNSVMLIGHNPAIHQIVVSLTDNAKLSRDDFMQLSSGMSPASVVLFEFSKLASWQDCASTKSRMTWFFKPSA